MKYFAGFDVARLAEARRGRPHPPTPLNLKESFRKHILPYKKLKAEDHAR